MSNPRQGPIDAEALEALLHRVAHDVRGAAGIVSGALDELERALGSEQTEAHASLLRMIRRSSRKLLLTADRYAMTADVVAQPLTLARRPVDDLGAVVREAVASVESAYARRGVRVDVSPPPNLPPISADPRWLAAAVAELITAAMRYARSVVSVSVFQESNRVLLRVELDGTVADGAARFSHDPSVDTLGLALVRDIMEAHGGSLDVARSGPGAPPKSTATLAFEVAR